MNMDAVKIEFGFRAKMKFENGLKRRRSGIGKINTYEDKLPDKLKQLGIKKDIISLQSNCSGLIGQQIALKV